VKETQEKDCETTSERPELVENLKEETKSIGWEAHCHKSRSEYVHSTILLVFGIFATNVYYAQKADAINPKGIYMYSMGIIDGMLLLWFIIFLVKNLKK